MSVIIKLLSKFDNSGLKKAQKGFSGLTKTLGAVGIGLGLKQITGDLMDAAKAASMDQKSTQLLNNQLIKNAKATTAQTKANDRFIQTLSEQVGIVDDELRPAQARLARATGSVSKSQELLKLALDASSVSGKPLATVSAALGKAFNGSTGALIKLFPELKKSKDLFGDLRKEVEGTAAQQADPFAKLNVAMDNLKEKLGVIILPLLTNFIDQMMKPGGAIDQVGKFLEDVSNPKTQVGATFVQIKETVKGLYDGIVNLGKLVVNLFSLDVNSMPLMNDLKEFFNLVNDIVTKINEAGDAIDKLLGKEKKLPSANGKSMPSQPTLFDNIGRTVLEATNPLLNVGALYSNLKGNFGGGNNSNNNVTINVQGADPKATVDALGKYVKQNGSLPFNLATVGKKP